MKIKFAAALSLFLAMNASAGTLECASADASLKYVFSRSDGGAPRGPSTSLVVAEKTLISIEPFGGSEINLAMMVFSGKESILDKTKTSDYETTWYSQKLKVTSKEDNSILFNEPVLCKKADYIGPPRP